MGLDKTENNIDVPPYISIPAHITKTRRSRKAYLTNEAVQCLRDWLDYKYRERRGYQKPSDISESYIFRMYDDNPTTPEQVEDMEKDMNLNYRSVYFYLQKDFKRLVENEGFGEKFRNNNHSVSIHSLRHYVVTTVEELTNVTSAYFWAGKKQIGYIFPEKDPKAVLELYKKVELRLTFLNPKIIKETEHKEIELLREEVKQMQEKIKQQRKDFLIDKFEQKIEDLHKEYVNDYIINGKLKPIPSDIPKERLNKWMKDSNVKLEEFAIITPQEIIEALEPINEDDRKILNEYIEENKPYVVLDLPNIAASELGISVDEVRKGK